MRLVYATPTGISLPLTGRNIRKVGLSMSTGSLRIAIATTRPSESQCWPWNGVRSRTGPNDSGVKPASWSDTESVSGAMILAARATTESGLCWSENARTSGRRLVMS